MRLYDTGNRNTQGMIIQIGVLFQHLSACIFLQYRHLVNGQPVESQQTFILREAFGNED